MDDKRALSVRIADYGSSLVADALAECGYSRQTAAPGLTPLHNRFVAAGTARTAWLRPVHKESDRGYEALAELIDSCEAGDIVVLATKGRVPPGAVWGELCTRAALNCRLAGAVLDAEVRDVVHLACGEFAVFARGVVSEAFLGRAMIDGLGETVSLRGVTVAPGDLIVADADGVVCCPRAALPEVLRRCVERKKVELEMLAALSRGENLLSLVRSSGTL